VMDASGQRRSGKRTTLKGWYFCPGFCMGKFDME
jgi:hypothetical protein